MGTPGFAVPSLDILLKNSYNIVGVVTAPDKKAGRGRKLQSSAIKKYAEKKGLDVYQPTKLKSQDFLNTIKKLNPNLIVVVAFRMLPAEVWQYPEYGTFNLHASLLPQYRGAAPINWAIINGETQTGVTSFFIDEKIDTGRIIVQEKTLIKREETAGSLHDKLMRLGANAVLKTVDLIRMGQVKTLDQTFLLKEDEKLKQAPKIFREDCVINWKNKSQSVYNFIRGLSPHPAAHTFLETENRNPFQLKIYGARIVESPADLKPAEIHTDGKNYLQIGTADGALEITELQLEGRNKVKTEEFLRGFDIQKYRYIATNRR